MTLAELCALDAVSVSIHLKQKWDAIVKLLIKNKRFLPLTHNIRNSTLADVLVRMVSHLLLTDAKVCKVLTTY